MVLKIINATEAKTGAMILVENEPYVVKSNDISKTGKHGHAKCRILANGVFVDRKKVITVPGHERFDVPKVDKKRVQVLNLSGDGASVMDLESYETIDVPIHPDVKEQVQAEKQAEVWDIEGKKMVMRVL
ncbi:MAG: translation initiation factor IF-5A [Nanoarchaeota archaeon]|nr:translation initiation factor IF-5A [Nanoarchaeota archaeon]MBU1052022.1 translation initiation factor IF-5A [Nanoarchaeota archaeon]